MAPRPACMAASSVLSVASTGEIPLPKEKGRPSLEVVAGAELFLPACMFSEDRGSEEQLQSRGG